MNKIVIDDSGEEVDRANEAQETTRSKAKTRGRLAIVMVVIGLLLVFLSVAYVIFLRDNDDTDQQKTNSRQSSNTDRQSTVAQKLLKPGNVVYADRANDNSPFVVYTRPATGGDRVSTITLPEDAYITQSAVKGNKVAIATAANDSKTSTVEVYYSADSGASYKKIYSQDETLGGDIIMGTQITSLIFAHDGQSIVMGMLSGDTNSYVATLSLTGNKKLETVFRAGQKAVFLVGYDASLKRAVYFTGCYNCDGNVSNPLYTRLGSGAESELYASPALFLKVVINDDFSKVLIAEGTKPSVEPNFLGDSSVAPYTLHEITLADKSKKTIGTIAEEQVQTVGYSVQGIPYAVTESKLISFGDSEQVILQTTGMLNLGFGRGSTGFVGENEMVYSQIINPNKGSDFEAYYFKTSEPSPVKIFEGGPNTYLLGVTRKE